MSERVLLSVRADLYRAASALVFKGEMPRPFVDFFESVDLVREPKDVDDLLRAFGNASAAALVAASEKTADEEEDAAGAAARLRSEIRARFAALQEKQHAAEISILEKSKLLATIASLEAQVEQWTKNAEEWSARERRLVEAVEATKEARSIAMEKLVLFSRMADLIKRTHEAIGGRHSHGPEGDAECVLSTVGDLVDSARENSAAQAESEERLLGSRILAKGWHRLCQLERHRRLVASDRLNEMRAAYDATAARLRDANEAGDDDALREKERLLTLRDAADWLRERQEHRLAEVLLQDFNVPSGKAVGHGG